MIVQDPSGLFFVQSQTQDESYLVDPKIKTCSCTVGKSGQFCKHILAVELHFPKCLVIPRIESREERYAIAVLAVGEDKVPPPSFFGLEDQPDCYQSVVDPIPAIESDDVADLEHSTPAIDILDQTPKLGINYAIAEEKVTAMCENLKNAILNKFKTNQDAALISGVEIMNETINKLKTQNGLGSSLHLFGKEAIGTASGKKRSRKIRVQPTGIARRAAGKPRSSAALQRGRPRNINRILKQLQPAKRQHNLFQNVMRNRTNGKKHGVSH